MAKLAVMARLRIYTVHINPSLPHPYEAAEFVPEGFTMRAAVFLGFWALYHRLWWQALLLLAYEGALLAGLANTMLSPSGLTIVDIGVRLIAGFGANEWLRNKLARQGYLTADITSGDSELRAEQRFFDRYLAAHA